MSTINITRITSADSATTAAISLLLKQLSPSQNFVFTERELAELISNPASAIFALYVDNQIVGMITLGSYLSPTGRKVWIEDVVVDESIRGCSIGRRLVQHAIEYAGELGPGTLMLTSRPSREAANALYRSCGFAFKETNNYTMSIPEKKN